MKEVLNKNFFSHKINDTKLISRYFFHFLDICQLRLDFDNLDITETATGVCTDSLTMVGPTGRNPMDLCGTLTGMHGTFLNLHQKTTLSFFLLFRVKDACS